MEINPKEKPRMTLSSSVRGMERLITDTIETIPKTRLHNEDKSQRIRNKRKTILLKLTKEKIKNTKDKTAIMPHNRVMPAIRDDIFVGG